MNPLLLRRRWMAQDAEVDYSKQYLTFVSLADNNEIKFFTNDANNTRTIYVSTDKNTWTTRTSSSTGTTLASLSNGGKLYVKVSVNLTGYSNGTYYHHFEATGDFALQGNIMSLLYSDNFWQQTALPSATFTFWQMFAYQDQLVDISNLVMPATTLRQGCYEGMFRDTHITSIPNNFLPATTCAKSCYYNMFRDCTGLTEIPSGLLPATTLATYCYGYMFYGCSNITTLPSTLLPATTLADYCYEYMFRAVGATTIPEGFLPATTLAVGCYQYMFVNSSVATVPSNLLPSTTLANSCYRAMFSTCASLTAAPDLPADTAVAYCYRSMFYQCPSIKSVKCLAIWGLRTTECTQAWLTGSPSGGTFYAKKNVTWVSGNSGIPSNWTRINV